MTVDELSNIVASIKKKQENIAVAIGVTFTLTLCIYFFTYAMMVDKGYSGMLWLMGISSILMLLTLIYLKPISFFITRLWLGKKSAYQAAFIAISSSDTAGH
ncbi:MAG: hypothetical protein Q9M31_04895 [Mariprofundus sp.]|nr:hypothetical protein [Mariprofundus sp.]